MRRRTKQLLQRLATIAIIIAVAVAIVMFFKPKKTIETSDSNINRKEYVGTIQDSKPVNIVLPENIVSTEENPNVSTNSTKTSDVKYEPIVSSKETYFIPFQTTEKEFKLLIGYDSEPLLEGSPVESTKEYVGAVITCENGQGYEFDISMIGR